MGKRRGAGEGSVFKRADGRWVATIDYGWVSGRRRRRTVYGRSRAEVVRKLGQLQRDRDRGVSASAVPTLESWLNHWLDEIAAPRLKPQTLRGYRGKVARYIIPELGPRRLDKLTPAQVRVFYRDLRERGLAEATIRQTHAILRKALHDAERDGLIARNVAALVEAPSTLSHPRLPLSVADARRVLCAADDTDRPARWWAALLLGMRQGECLGLRWCDVELDAAILHVRQTQVLDRRERVAGTPKSAAGRRDIPLPRAVLSRLAVEWARHVAAGGDVMDLVWPRHPRGDWGDWSTLLRAAGVDHVALHAARNTAASLLEAQGVPDRMVAQILGQSQVAVTHRYQYADVDRVRTALEGVGQALAHESAAGEAGDVLVGQGAPKFENGLALMARPGHEDVNR